MYKLVVAGLLCAIAGAILILPVAFSQVPTMEHDGAFIMPLLTGVNLLGLVMGVSCCQDCKGINLLTAAILFFGSSVFGGVAMALYSIYDIGYYFPVVCFLGWFAVLATTLAAVFYMCAFAKRKSS